MLDQLVASVSQKTGLPPDKAQAAVENVVSQIKAKLPPSVSSHIDDLMSGKFNGTLADAEAKFKAHFGGASMADMSSKLKDGLSGVQDKLNSMLHKNP